MSPFSKAARRRSSPAHARPRRSRRAARLGGLVAFVLLAAAGGVFLAVSTRHPEVGALADAGAHEGARAGTPGERTDAAKTKTPPPLVQPTAARPLSLLEIGDSLGEDLGFGLDDLLGHDPRVRLHLEAVGDTGLANVNYYNWPATFEREVDAYHPGLVVVFIGGNDAQGFDVGDQPAVFGTTFWHSAYSARVRTMMSEATAAGAHVLWVGMPPMAPGTVLSPAMAKLDGIYATVAKSFPLVRYLSTWRLFENAQGQFATALPDASGQLVDMRDPDGVHLTGAGGDRVAQAVVDAAASDWHFRL